VDGKTGHCRSSKVWASPPAPELPVRVTHAVRHYFGPQRRRLACGRPHDQDDIVQRVARKLLCALAVVGAAIGGCGGSGRPPSKDSLASADVSRPRSWTPDQPSSAGHGETAGPDASVVATDANMLAQEIYARQECPPRLLSPSLEVRPTTVCSGTEPSMCWKESCLRASDCSARPFGRCAGYDRSGGYIEYASCEYEGCHTDLDCESGQACACTGEGRRSCVSAACRVDADCVAGSRCIRADACGWGPFGPFLCTSDAFECRTNQDCLDKHLGNSCTTWDGDHFECVSIICD
jgi:hypothetical protein